VVHRNNAPKSESERRRFEQDGWCWWDSRPGQAPLTRQRPEGTARIQPGVSTPRTPEIGCAIRFQAISNTLGRPSGTSESAKPLAPPDQG
jgi:hypothetical protein